MNTLIEKQIRKIRENFEKKVKDGHTISIVNRELVYIEFERAIQELLESFAEKREKEVKKQIRKEFGEIYLPQINEKSFGSPIIEIKATVRQTAAYLKKELNKILLRVPIKEENK